MAPWDEALVRFAFDFARRVTGHDADAEDLAQEALLELAEAEPSRPAAVGVRAFVGRRIVLGAKMLRRANLTRARHERAVARQGVEGRGEEGAEARDALGLLDPEDRHAVELRFLHGLSYAEVAHVLGVTEPAARMRVHRALGSLRARLGPRAESMLAALPLFVAPPSMAIQTARAAALLGGGIAMKKIAVLIVLLAIAGGGVVVSRAMRESPPSRAERSRASVEGAAAVEPEPEASAETALQPPRMSGADEPPPGQHTLVGRIIFEDGEPLRRAELRLLGTDRTFATTDEDGGFRLQDEVVAGAHVGIVQRKDSYVAIARAEPNVVEPLRMDVTLQRGTLLEGVVMKAGSPVPNANIMLQRPAAQATGTVQGSFGVCKADGEGRFLFPLLPDGLYSLVVTRYGIEPRHAEIDVKAGLPPQVVVVKDARPLRIRIVPLPATWRGKQMMLRIYSMGRDPISLLHILAPDDRGEILVAEAPPPGRYLIDGLPAGSREFEINEAEAPVIVIDLSRFGRVVGTVSTASTPCEVRVGPARAATDAEGRYEIDLVPPGRAQVSLLLGKTLLERPWVTVPASGELRLDIDLRGVALRGRVRHDGDPRHSGASLRRPGQGPLAQAWIDDEGRFSIPFTEPGEYEIFGWSGGGMQGRSRSIVVGAQDLDVGILFVDREVEVPVVVVAPAGARLAGSQDLWAAEGSRAQMVPLRLDESGRGVAWIPPGKWRLSLHVGDLPQKDVEVEVPVREPVRFDLAR